VSRTIIYTHKKAKTETSADNLNGLREKFDHYNAVLEKAVKEDVKALRFLTELSYGV
jgi:hypothetical protein